MSVSRCILVAFVCLLSLCSCTPPDPEYGQETTRFLPTKRRQVWAIAPVQNLSGEQGVDAFLQADLFYHQLQTVRGVTVIPVNRVAEVYLNLRIDKVSSPEQAALVCDLLGCDGLIVTNVTIFEPYNPPKFGAAMQLFLKPGTYARPSNIDPRELARRSTPKEVDAVVNPDAIQIVGMFDAINGSVRDALAEYAVGRHEPMGPLGPKEYLLSMDRYVGFCYSMLIDQLISSPKLKGI